MYVYIPFTSNLTDIAFSIFPTFDPKASTDAIDTKLAKTLNIIPLFAMYPVQDCFCSFLGSIRELHPFSVAEWIVLSVSLKELLEDHNGVLIHKKLVKML